MGASARNAVLEYGAEIQLRRHQQGTDEGEAVHEFAAPEPIWASIRPESAYRDFDIGIEGQEDATIYVLAALELPSDVPTDDTTAVQEYLDVNPKVVHPPLQEDDRIITEDRAWRLVERLYSPQNSLSRFIVIEDGRGQSQDVDEDGTGSDDDSPPFAQL